MTASFNLVFFNARLSILAAIFAVVSGMLVKLYLDTNLPVIMFFIISYLLFYIYKNCLTSLFKTKIIEIQGAATAELMATFDSLEKLIKKP
jgi:hypothetical protein